MIDPATAWLNALAFLAGYGAAELQHRIRKHLRSVNPPKGSGKLTLERWVAARNLMNKHTNPTENPSQQP